MCYECLQPTFEDCSSRKGNEFYIFQLQLRFIETRNAVLMQICKLKKAKKESTMNLQFKMRRFSYEAH